jgi:UDP-N-acetylmuramate--alanine ligase
MQFQTGQHIHLVGIGGYGLSAIARVLLLRGVTVSGSDRGHNALAAALAQDGATVHHGHAGEYVNGADMVIISSAIPDDHVEVAAARAQGIPVYKRRDILAALMADRRVFAAAGTHGKTTTTSMLVHILRECGQDPDYIVGGVLGNTGTNAGVGQGGLFVIEADEYDHMFLGLNPDVAIITSIEYDHPDLFKTPAQMYDAFDQFAGRVRDNDGLLVVCADDPRALELGRAFPNVISYGLNDGLERHVGARDLRDQGDSMHFVVDWLGEDEVEIRLPLAGLHNVRNACAAMAACYGISGMPVDAVWPLAAFKPAGRRFEIVGEVDGVVVVDDYTVHPTAVIVTLEAARRRYPDHAIWAVWQPHTFSRTQGLLGEFSTAFADAGHVRVTDIFAAREDPVPGVDGASTAAAIDHPDVRYVSGLDAMTRALLDEVQSPAVIIVMSAGDGPQISAGYVNARTAREKG